MYTFRAFTYKARLSACSYITTQCNSKQLTLLNAFRASAYKVRLSACSCTTIQHNTTQHNSLFECIQGLRIQGLSACSYTTTQHNATQNNTKGVHIQGLPFCLQWHHHITQHNTAQLKTTLSLNAFRASTYNACLSACSRTNTPQNYSLLERFQGLRIQGLLSACSHTTTQPNTTQKQLTL